MERLDWDRDYSVHIDELDSHHQELFNIFNRMLDFCDLESGSSQADAIVKDLFDYADDHFKIEEAYMLKYEYPENDRRLHEAEHRSFRVRVRKMMKEVSAGESAQAMANSVSFLSSWLRNHILQSDRRYYHYFEYRGHTID